VASILRDRGDEKAVVEEIRLVFYGIRKAMKDVGPLTSSHADFFASNSLTVSGSVTRTEDAGGDDDCAATRSPS